MEAHHRKVTDYYISQLCSPSLFDFLQVRPIQSSRTVVTSASVAMFPGLRLRNCYRGKFRVYTTDLYHDLVMTSWIAYIELSLLYQPAVNDYSNDNLDISRVYFPAPVCFFFGVKLYQSLSYNLHFLPRLIKGEKIASKYLNLQRDYLGATLGPFNSTSPFISLAYGVNERQLIFSLHQPILLILYSQASPFSDA
jgi:hypothetical protein